MRKYIIGTIFGFVLATAVGANAQEVNRLVDSVVQGVFPVTVEGTSVGEAIVVNDKTYLPVREFGEAVGYKVTFTEDREVVLTKTEVVAENTSKNELNQESMNDIVKKAKDEIRRKKPIQDQIIDLTNEIAHEQDNIESYKLYKTQNENFMNLPNMNKEEQQKVIDSYSKNISDAEARIADYQAQITALQSQK